MTTALGRPEKYGALLVEFRYGDPLAPTFTRYCDIAQDTQGYTATENLEVELPANTGAFSDQEGRISLPKLDSFTTNLSGGLPHSPVFVKITELTVGLFAGDQANESILFEGRVTRSVRNFQGDNGVVAIFIKSVKSRIDVPMGIACNMTCNFGLFRGACGNKRAQFTYQAQGQIAVIDGQEVTVSTNSALTAPTSPGGNVDRYWERGYLQKDGLQIGIRIWLLTDPTVFVLRRRPPDSWLLAGVASILFVPGCHKNIEDCRTVWDNEENFQGPGYAMLEYNPIIERG